MKREEKMWAISGLWDNGKRMLYCGTSLTRKDAIANHGSGWPLWTKYRRNGDRAVKVTVTWDDGKPAKRRRSVE